VYDRVRHAGPDMSQALCGDAAWVISGPIDKFR
jgi:hypothetical protein